MFGPFPFFGVFLLTEATTIPFSLNLGVYNVAAVFHVILIFYPRSFNFFLSFNIKYLTAWVKNLNIFSVGQYLQNKKEKIRQRRHNCAAYTQVLIAIIFLEDKFFSLEK